MHELRGHIGTGSKWLSSIMCWACPVGSFSSEAGETQRESSGSVCKNLLLRLLPVVDGLNKV